MPRYNRKVGAGGGYRPTAPSILDLGATLSKVGRGLVTESLAEDAISRGTQGGSFRIKEGGGFWDAINGAARADAQKQATDFGRNIVRLEMAKLADASEIDETMSDDQRKAAIENFRQGATKLMGRVSDDKWGAELRLQLDAVEGNLTRRANRYQRKEVEVLNAETATMAQNEILLNVQKRINSGDIDGLIADGESYISEENLADENWKGFGAKVNDLIMRNMPLAGRKAVINALSDRGDVGAAFGVVKQAMENNGFTERDADGVLREAIQEWVIGEVDPREDGELPATYKQDEVERLRMALEPMFEGMDEKQAKRLMGLALAQAEQTAAAYELTAPADIPIVKETTPAMRGITSDVLRDMKGKPEAEATDLWNAKAQTWIDDNVQRFVGGVNTEEKVRTVMLAELEVERARMGRLHRNEKEGEGQGLSDKDENRIQNFIQNKGREIIEGAYTTVSTGDALGFQRSMSTLSTKLLYYTDEDAKEGRIPKGKQVGDFYPGGEDIQAMLETGEAWNQAHSIWVGREPVRREGGWGGEPEKIAKQRADFLDKLRQFRGFQAYSAEMKAEGIDVLWVLDDKSGEVAPVFNFARYEAENPKPQKDGDEADLKRRASDKRVMDMFIAGGDKLTGAEIADYAPQLRQIEYRNKGKLETFGRLSYSPMDRYKRSVANLWGERDPFVNPKAQELLDDPAFVKAFESVVTPLRLFRPSDNEQGYQAHKNRDGLEVDYRYVLMADAAEAIYKDGGVLVPDGERRELKPGTTQTGIIWDSDGRFQQIHTALTGWADGIGAGRPTQLGEKDYKNPFDGRLKVLTTGKDLPDFDPALHSQTMAGFERELELGNIIPAMAVDNQGRLYNAFVDAEKGELYTVNGKPVVIDPTREPATR